jgi:hypothetical protein
MNTDYILSTLKKAQKEECLVAVYSDTSHPNEFRVGLVSSCDIGILVLILVSTHGEPSKICVIKLKAIFKIEINSKYLIALSKVYKNRGFVYSSLSDKEEHFRTTTNKYLKVLIKNKELVTLSLGKRKSSIHTINGYFESFNKKFFRLKNVNNLGEDDGVVIGRLNDIRKIELRSKDQLKLKFLNAG